MRRYRLLSVGFATLTIAGVMVGAPAHAAGVEYANTPENFGLRTDGTVRAVEVVGTTAYIGGSFGVVRGGNGTFSRANVAAFDITTGNIVTGFTANTDGGVHALEVDGDAIYVGGDFSTVNGTTKHRVVRVNRSNGAVQSGFTTNPAGRVRTIERWNDQLWIGGTFTTVSGTSRNRIAAVDPTTGALLAPNPNANRPVASIEVNREGTALFVGGEFSYINGQNRPYLVRMNNNGQIDGFRFQGLQTNGNNFIIDLAVDPNRGTLYGGMGGAWGQGLGNSVAAWDLATGAVRWRHMTEGDVQAVAVQDDTVYFGFHEGFQNDFTKRLAAADANTGQLNTRFRPTMNSFYGVWDLAATPSGLVAGGEFTTVQGVDTRRVAVFAPVVVSEMTLVGQQSWRYSDVGPIAAGWQATGFNDSSWRTGLPEFGYGDGDEATVVRFGPSSSNKFITTYFRTSFSVDNPTALANVTLSVLADDGAVVYVNGVEVARDLMPTGTITYNTLARWAKDGAAERTLTTFVLPSSVLRQGTNVVAVEVHQATSGSSDISFDLRMTASREQ